MPSRLVFHVAWLIAILVAPAASEAQFYGNYQQPMPANLQQFPLNMPFAQQAVPQQTGPPLHPLPLEVYPQASAEFFAGPAVSSLPSPGATPQPGAIPSAMSATITSGPTAGPMPTAALPAPPSAAHRRGGDVQGGVVQVGGTSELRSARRQGDPIDAAQYFVPFETNAGAFRPKRRSTSAWIQSSAK